MMIGQRFRPLGWVAGVTTAATCLYMVSLQVAAERGKLEAVEHQIAIAQRDMRQLQTELGTRASLRQLEKWNGDVLALSAPKAQQFLHGEAELASLGSSAIDDGTPNAPPAVMNASFSPDMPETAVIAVAAEQRASPPPASPPKAKAPNPTLLIKAVATKPKKPPVESASVRAGFQRAIFHKPQQPTRVQRVAMLDPKIMRDINRSAEKERRKRP